MRKDTTPYSFFVGEQRITGRSTVGEERYEKPERPSMGGHRPKIGLPRCSDPSPLEPKPAAAGAANRNAVLMGSCSHGAAHLRGTLPRRRDDHSASGILGVCPEAL